MPRTEPTPDDGDDGTDDEPTSSTPVLVREPRFRDFSRADEVESDAAKIEPKGFSLNGLDFECRPKATHEVMAASWRIQTARWKAELQQAYADFIDAALTPDAIPAFHAALRNPLRPVMPEQVRDIVQHLSSEYADRPTEPSSSS